MCYFSRSQYLIFMVFDYIWLAENHSFLAGQNFNSNLMLDEIGIIALGHDKEIDHWAPLTWQRWWEKEKDLTIIAMENSYTSDDATNFKVM